jgi:Rrf2 family protein
MLSQKAKYALRALLVLAESGDARPLLIADIAERHNLPKKFLEQILLDLKHHGLVQSRRGRSGGYTLLKPASEISFGQVVRIIDGPLAPLPCLSRMAYRRCEECPGEESCAIRRVFALTHEVTSTVLDRTTLADALREAPVQRRFVPQEEAPGQRRFAAREMVG